MNITVDDASPLILRLGELRLQQRLPARIYRAICYAHNHGFVLPATVGEFCEMLCTPQASTLLLLPKIGPQSVIILRELFLDERAASDSD